MVKFSCLRDWSSDDTMGRNVKTAWEISAGEKWGPVWGFRHEEPEVVVGHLMDVPSKRFVASQSVTGGSLPCLLYAPNACSAENTGQKIRRDWAELNFWFQGVCSSNSIELHMPHFLRMFMAGLCALCHLLWVCDVAGVQHPHEVVCRPLLRQAG